MNSFMSWIGGKKALREEIVARFPLDYTRYIEVFGGGGWILFHKPPDGDFEVYNDFNPNLANLYRCVRDHPEELCDELRYTLNSRLDFEYVKKMMHSRTDIPDIKKAAYFYQLIRYSYASGLDSFGAQPHPMWNNFPLVHQACYRLQHVIIENKDFEKLIQQYDRAESFFYCDPPYYNTEDSLGKIMSGLLMCCAMCKVSFCYLTMIARRSEKCIPDQESLLKLLPGFQILPSDMRRASSMQSS